jgi:hypothetical protein
MHEVFWLAYVVLFAFPTCVFIYILYVQCFASKEEVQQEAAKESVVLEAADAHQHVQPEQPKQLPSPAEVVVNVTPPERPSPPPYKFPPIYPDPHAASAAKAQMPRIYIHAVCQR